jgi:predicted esterase
MRSTLVAAVLSIAAFAPAGAQSLSAALPGKTGERIPSASNATQTYAVHLPAAYDSTRSWPIAFLMDPRGRALIPLERMRTAADRFGYILLSSYNTISDSASDANVLAVNAMLSDAQKSLRIDTRRIYLVGFSGTARISWNFADGLKGRVAGIFGAGASGLNYVLELQGAQPTKPAYYGTMGVTDFNYEEMRSFEPWLAQQSIPRRVRYFSGGHQWPADSLFTEALAWFELRAMKDGLRAVDHAFVDSMYKADLRNADALESGERKLEALIHWREIAADYEGLANVDNARVRVRSLLNDGAVKRALSEREDLHQDFIEFNRELTAWITRAREDERTPEANDAIKKLKVDQRVKVAGDEKQPARALAAQRELEQAFVTLSFYQPKELLAKRDPARALVFLDVAERIKPRSSRVALFRAYAFLQQERVDDALRALEQAVGAGLPRALLVDDPSLAALRGNPRFQELSTQSTR